MANILLRKDSLVIVSPLVDVVIPAPPVAVTPATASAPMSREEHTQLAQKLLAKRALSKPPRRSQSATACDSVAHAQDIATTSRFGDSGHALEMGLKMSRVPQSHVTQQWRMNLPVRIQPPTPPMQDHHHLLQYSHRPPRKQGIRPPRRSYSVTDRKPVDEGASSTPQRLYFVDLPIELHYAVFRFLDPMDSACIGVTCRHFYSVHRSLYGKVPLSSRRSGPNNLEWAWRLAGYPAPVGLGGFYPGAALAAQQSPPLPSSPTALVPVPISVPVSVPVSMTGPGLAAFRPRGQVWCAKCGVFRCELHQHLSEWMGPGYEYCYVRQVFGRPAPAGARAMCYRRSPKHPNRCGRHHTK